MKTLLLFFMVCVSTSVFAQQTAAIDSCADSTSVRPTQDQLSELFSARGLYLDRKYDWSEPIVNCHINKAIALHSESIRINDKVSRRYKTASWIFIPGLAFLTTGLLTGSTGLIVPGLLFGGVGATFIIGNKESVRSAENKRIESEYHYGEVNKYYKEKGWYD